MALENIPHEMRSYRQWVRRAADKIPLNPRTGTPASVTDPNTWASFDEAIASPHGIGYGFVFTENDPYTGIDLDVKPDEQPTAEQLAIFNEFDSYAELSPSGRGLHIIVRGKVPTIKRKGIEVYSALRYFTMTGDVLRPGPIADHSANLQAMWARMGGDASQAAQDAPDAAQTASDREVIDRARNAVNGAKFSTLYAGNWQGEYPSQSEADQALINIIGFYSKNREQVARIFRASALGQRDKAKRSDYMNRMLSKAFDRDSALAKVSIQLANPFEKPEARLFSFAAISPVEWGCSKLSPEVIVDNYLFADVGILIAPGGVGKTTLVIYEAICIALGFDLYGRIIRKPGRVIIVSAEDAREQIIARLVRIASSMRLASEQIELIKQNVLIEYVGGEDFRLCNVSGDVVTNSPHVDRLIDAIKPLNPSLLVIDPAVSFGVGESRVNDAEQGLIRAARRIRDAVGCCVRLVHHTGKQNGRDGAIDQYAGRGGSAMADGARMVAVLKRMTAEDWHKETGESLPEGADGLLLALPKLSYAPAQPHIYLERNGFAYRHVQPSVQTVEDKCAVIDATVIEFLKSEEAKGINHSKSSLEQSETIGLSRNEVRRAIARLEAANRITTTAVPGRGQGQRIRVVEFSPPPVASNAPVPVQKVLS